MGDRSQERSAQVVLFVRSVEESDPEGQLLSRQARLQATRRALMVTGLLGGPEPSPRSRRIRSSEAVTRRARLLFDGLVRRYPSLDNTLHVAKLGASTAPTAVLLTFGLGLLASGLDPGRYLGLIALPLVGLIAWNLSVVIASFARSAARRGNSWLIARAAGWLLRAALGRRLRAAERAAGSGDASARILARAIMRFGALWRVLAGPLLASRLRSVLHLAAIAFVAGVVGGMYLRGLGLGYRASWNSRWIDAGGMQALVEILLGPAAALTGIHLPDVAPLQGPAGSGDPAPWIHLWAVTAFVTVAIPRALLALAEAARGARLAARVQLDLEDGYFQRLFATWHSGGVDARVLPYAVRPGTATAERLRGLLQELFGARAAVRVADPLAQGADPPALAPVPGRMTCWIVLFQGDEPPDEAVHGRFLAALKVRLDPAGERLLVLLDTSRAERQQAWERLLAAAGLDLVALDLARPLDTANPASQTLGRLRRALWPAEVPAS